MLSCERVGSRALSHWNKDRIASGSWKWRGRSWIVGRSSAIRVYNHDRQANLGQSKSKLWEFSRKFVSCPQWNKWTTGIFEQKNGYKSLWLSVLLNGDSGGEWKNIEGEITPEHLLEWRDGEPQLNGIRGYAKSNGKSRNRTDRYLRDSYKDNEKSSWLFVIYSHDLETRTYRKQGFFSKRIDSVFHENIYSSKTFIYLSFLLRDELWRFSRMWWTVNFWETTFKNVWQINVLWCYMK